MSLLENLKWRYATKKFDATKKVSEDDVNKIVEAARLAPTSSGLQQFRVIVVTNQELKEKIVPIAWGQQIVADCSHLLVFAAWDKYTAERIDDVFNATVAERQIPYEQVAAYVERLKSIYLNQSAEENFVHTARQAYIGFGLSIAQAAELKVDATPMEGFTSTDLDALLGLEAKGLKSVTMLPLGYRDAANDWLVNLKKVRVSTNDFVIEYR
ncbi:Nitroreductase [Flexibacter flexilis DSM 6793]|uniref:Nitroreductase n=1 Tax=Flexibacter flexilis DSM 6793 TaxID=927664 RepID=A0A1I1DM40_9BACT|nr:NAD(P)H-dependent oxidoreductase [Flexibacter flexilis]SFB73583.1 Nitroreductase [Flexibacter flexilis DSM 6793]